jgi:hypothetical protein
MAGARSRSWGVKIRVHHHVTPIEPRPPRLWQPQEREEGHDRSRASSEASPGLGEHAIKPHDEAIWHIHLQGENILDQAK